MRKRFSLSFTSCLIGLAAIIGLGNRALAGPIVDGSLVVVRVGDGTTAPTANALPVNLDEYSITYVAGIPTSATLLQSIPLSITPAASGDRALTIGGTASVEGGLNASQDGQYLVVGGYNTAPGTAGANGTTSRVVGRVDRTTGLVDTTTALTDINAAGSAIRSVTTTYGADMWVGSSNNGIRYATLGATTSTQLANTNTRRTEVFSTQLYLDAAAAGIFGVATVGTGTPTTAGQTVTIVPGMPTTTGPSPYDFFFADSNTLYVADDRTSTSGGLQKWLFDGSNWSLAYTRNVNTAGALPNGLRGLTGFVDGANVTLFGTTTFGTTGAVNMLIGLTDTLANTNPVLVTENSLATAAATYNLRGVEITIPEPVGMSLLVLALLPLRRHRG